uniref:Phosphatidylinositol transfer protein N-terminal domain-containing protein n=1 Tax=Physcomitrium patens TaxID=3218 RepID=A0A7I4CES5_PHYPA
MVQIVEFRVIMPLLLEEYRVAQMYMVNKIQEQQTGGGEGVEVLINKPFENEEFGRGQYTSKIYHLQSKIPSWLSAFVSTKFMYIEEEAWNAFPKCKTVLKCPYLNRFKLTIETIHVADNGNTVNAHNLDKDALALRKVEYLDIASNVKDYWNYVIGGPEIDLTKFKSEITGRGPLAPGWQAERALFLESHKQCFHWIDEWFGLTYEDVRRMEMENDLALNQKLGKLTIVSNACENGSSAGIAESASEPVKKDASLPSSVSVRS